MEVTPLPTARCLVIAILGLMAASGVIAQELVIRSDAVKRFKSPAIKEVVVGVASARSKFGYDEDCSGFAIKPRQARRFLSHAKPVTERSYDHDYPWSECRAEGAVTYRDGRRGEWTIEREGRGLLEVREADGKRVLYHLYCACGL